MLNICQRIVTKSTIEMSTNTSLLARWTDWTCSAMNQLFCIFRRHLKTCKTCKSEGGGGSDQISQVLLEKGEKGGQVMFVGIRMSETVTFARVNLNHNLGGHFWCVMKLTIVNDNCLVSSLLPSQWELC